MKDIGHTALGARMEVGQTALLSASGPAWSERPPIAGAVDLPFTGQVERPSFQDSVELAAQMTGSPMAAITLLDEHYQQFKAKVGLCQDSTPRDIAFCRFTVESDDLFTVPDAQEDPRFVNNPLVTGDPHVRAYAGMPLVAPDGSRIGAICVLDTMPRIFSKREEAILQLLAKQIMTQLQLEQLINRQASDIHELEKVRTDLRHLAMHDDLTGLLNRRGLIEAMETHVSVAHHPFEDSKSFHDPATSVSALFIDLDGFKPVNDRLGHDTGDHVLIVIGLRLSSAVPPGSVVGRLGGDEFVVVLFDDDLGGVAQATENLLQCIEKPISVAGHTVTVEASAGIAHTRDPYNLIDLIDQADEAMYWSKELGGRRVSLWSKQESAMRTSSESNVNKFVRATLTENRLTVHYQPMFDLSTGEMIRREALLRWSGTSPAGVDVECFITAAEHIGLIHDVGELVLHTACSDAAAWQSQHPNVGVSVNVSALQITGQFAKVVSDVLDLTGLRPDLLTLELTETTVLARSAATDATLAELHRMGVRLSLDDFGTGYASMSLLCALPLDEIKIDRQFCSSPTGAERKIVQAAVELGHSLGLCVVAEGIETLDIVDVVVDSGCDVGQGYLLGHPAALNAASS